jgi:intracellular multiplication protein IcmD
MMWTKSFAKVILLFIGTMACFCLGTDVLAFSSASGTGIGAVASNVRGNLANIAYLITAGSYVAGMGFGVGAVVKFKAHKDNPTQIPIGMPIALLFVAAALLFIPTVFKTTGSTLFGASGVQASVSGIKSF